MVEHSQRLPVRSSYRSSCGSCTRYPFFLSPPVSLLVPRLVAWKLLLRAVMPAGLTSPGL